jgi:flagellar protein FliO/FliZ
LNWQENLQGQVADQGKDLEATSQFEVWPAFLNMIFVLALVVIGIILLAWLFRKFMGSRLALGNPSFMRLINSIPLGDRRFISILKVGEKYYLLGISNSDIRNLAELDKEEVEKGLNVEEQVAAEGGFAGILNMFQKRRGDGEK